MQSIALRVATASLFVVALAACGGGGSSATPPVTPISTTLPDTAATLSTAEGFWIGSSSTGTEVQLAVFENGEMFGFYTSARSLIGSFYGTTSDSTTTLSGSGYDRNYPTGSNTQGITYSGTVSSKNNIKIDVKRSVGVRIPLFGGTVFTSNPDADVITFTGDYSATYEQAATLENLAGTYLGFGNGSSITRPVTVIISTNGSITASYFSCVISGTASPHASGRNAFKVQTTSTGSGCGNPTESAFTATGIAFYEPKNRQFNMMIGNQPIPHFTYVGLR